MIPSTPEKTPTRAVLYMRTAKADTFEPAASQPAGPVRAPIARTLQRLINRRCATEPIQITQQRQRLLASCENRGFAVCGEYSDVGAGTTILPGLQLLLADTESYDAVVITELFRIARRAELALAVLSGLRASGVTVYVPDGHVLRAINVDAEFDSTSWIDFNITAAFLRRPSDLHPTR